MTQDVALRSRGNESDRKWYQRLPLQVLIAPLTGAGVRSRVAGEMMTALLMMAGLSGQAASPSPAVPGQTLGEALRTLPTDACAAVHPGDIVICKRQDGSRYRIDRTVLDAVRAHDAEPIKPPVEASNGSDKGCVGPQACTGGVVPLVGMALATAKAVALAVEGDDWRDAFRTREEEYRLYKEQQARRESEQHKVRIGFGAGTSR